MGILAIQNGDYELVSALGLIVSVIVGFIVVNFPKGLIFWEMEGHIIAVLQYHLCRYSS